MAKLPYYTSNSLVDAVKRKISFPISQNTFSVDDILAFANEEMFLSQVPSIMQYHEEYFVFTKTVPLQGNVSRYALPTRSIGMKLRDVFYKSIGGQLVEMSRINPDDKSFMQTKGNSFPTPIYFYIENNDVVITPNVNDAVVGDLVFSFYMRPNSLVTDDKAAICQSFSKTLTVDISTLIAGDTITINGTILTAGTDFLIGLNDATTASNIANSINSTFNNEITASSNGGVVTTVYQGRTTAFSTSNSVAIQIQQTITLNTTAVPEEIVSGSLVDILQMDGGHSTLAYDVKLAANSVSLNSITFAESDLPATFIVGDYICSRYECIVPQIPTDLHNLLAERVCARILEALGDKEGLKATNEKIVEQEYKQATLLDSRVEGAPLKVTNRSGLLNSAKIKFGRRTT